MTPHVGGTASRKACISRAGVRCSAKPRVRKKRFSRSSVMALVMLVALLHRQQQVGAGQQHHDRVHPPLMLQPLARAAHSRPIAGSPLPLTAARSTSIPSCAAVRIRVPVGTMNQMRPATTTISTSTASRDCQRKIVFASGMMPPTHRPGRHLRHSLRHRVCHRAACPASPSAVRRNRSGPGPRRSRARAASTPRACGSPPTEDGARRPAPAPRRTRG